MCSISINTRGKSHVNRSVEQVGCLSGVSSQRTELWGIALVYLYRDCSSWLMFRFPQYGR